MSNDLIKSIKSDLATMGPVETGVDEDSKAVAGSGEFGKRISIKGGVFRKIVGGKEVGVIEDRFMNVIFVKMAHDYSRTYYTDGYIEGAKVGPVCWSSNAKTPDVSVKHPQAPACDKCPHSVKGTGQNGKGTACRLSRRTAVVLPRDPAGDVMQLVLPATSIFGKEREGRWPHTAYIQMLVGNDISANRVITKMSFDTAQAVPTLLFQPVGPVPREDQAIVVEQGKSTAAENAVKLTVFQQDEEPVPPAQPAAERAPVQMELPLQQPSEPTLRKTAATAEAPAATPVPDIIKKWSKKA